MAYDLSEEESNDGSKQDKTNELGKIQSKDKKPKKDRKSPTKSKAQIGPTTPGNIIKRVLSTIQKPFFLSRLLSSTIG